MISIVIPLYNKERSIAKTLECVLSQTWQDFEVVVVDDGSTDRSAEVVKRCTDPRIRLISQKNAGVSAARNRGIAEARGEWVALLDADDEWEPDYLATQVALSAAHPDCDVCATSYAMVSGDGRRQEAILRKLPFEGDNGVLTNYFEVASCSHPPICSISIMARKSAFETVGGFPLGVKSGEDLLTWARLAARFRIAYDCRPKAIFNVEGYDRHEKPKRQPAEVDVVAAELAALKREFAPAHIDAYRAHWHKMRSSIYTRLGNRRKAIAEAWKGIRIYPANFKLYVFIAVNILPIKI